MISRRSFMQSLGAGAAMLPMLMGDKAFAQTQKFPRRLIILYWPNGVVPMDFWPSGGVTDFTLGETLSPLAPYRDKMVVLGGVDLQSHIDEKSTDGSQAMGHDAAATLLTGHKLARFVYQDYQAGGQSVDQFLGDTLAARHKLPVKSLVAGVAGGGFSSLSWSAARQPVRWDNSPQSLFDRLFGGTALSDDALTKLRASRRSILDVMGGELARFARNLGTDDRLKVDAHLASIRDIELELEAARPVCTEPTLPSGASADYSPPRYPQMVKTQTDILVAGLRCDITRVVTVKWSSDFGDDKTFPFLGSEFTEPGDEPGRLVREHHDIAHTTHWSADNTRRKILVDRWYYEQVAYFVRQLASTPEGDGSMLDNSAVVVMNNMSDGDWHGLKGLPWTIIGSCGGYFKTGQFLKPNGWERLNGNYWGNVARRGEDFAPGVPHNRLLTSLCHAMEVPVETFGDTNYGTGEMPGLKA